MPVSVNELREQARLLEAELSRQETSIDSSETKGGVLLAGVLVGLLVQVKHPNVALRTAEAFALRGTRGAGCCVSSAVADARCPGG